MAEWEEQGRRTEREMGGKWQNNAASFNHVILVHASLIMVF